MGAAFLEIVLAQDISVGGIGIYVTHGFDGYNIEDEVEFIVRLPSQRPFQGKGILRRKQARSPGALFGLEFTELPAPARERIAVYVAARLRGESGRDTTV